MGRVVALVLLSSVATAAFGQSLSQQGWTFTIKGDVRANYRDSRDQVFALKVPVPAADLPPGRAMTLETADPGSHAELSLASLILQSEYKNVFGLRVKADADNLYYRNPTSTGDNFNIDELWVRFGVKPEGFNLPNSSSFFLQMGKVPKLERQQVRLLESYGLATMSFSRFTDVGFFLGGTLGRHLYWRGTLTTGNPLFIRDPNALAGDTNQIVNPTPNESTTLNAGIPILYDAHVDKLFYDGSHPELTAALGYRIAFDQSSGGIDLVAFERNRKLADATDLVGAEYPGDLELLHGEGFGSPLLLHGTGKRETGARLDSEWKGLTLFAEAVRQNVAGLRRSGYELETGWEIPIGRGPVIAGNSLFRSIQPAARVSALVNHFRGAGTFVDPSIWWDWTKIDYGLRLGLLDRYDLTVEYSRHVIDAPVELHPDETLVTFRIRI